MKKMITVLLSVMALVLASGAHYSLI